MLLQMKKESLEASSRSLTRYGAAALTLTGSRSMRNRNFGEERIASSAHSMPSSKVPFDRPAS